jgi:hypothetical protein
MVSVQRPRHSRRRGLQPVVPAHAGGGDDAGDTGQASPALVAAYSVWRITMVTRLLL